MRHAIHPLYRRFARNLVRHCEGEINDASQLLPDMLNMISRENYRAVYTGRDLFLLRDLAGRVRDALSYSIGAANRRSRTGVALMILETRAHIAALVAEWPEQPQA